MTPTPIFPSGSSSGSPHGSDSADSGAAGSGQSESSLEISQSSLHGGPNGDLLKDSLLYKEFVAERDEILRHKWLESEKAGHDIGFEKALLDWVLRYRAQWRLQRSGGGGMAGAR
jgi:hypothetical protein